MTPVLLLALLAQTPGGASSSPPSPALAAPAIPADLQTEFWRASAAVAEIALAQANAAAEKKAAWEALREACGPAHEPQMVAKRLACAARAEGKK